MSSDTRKLTPDSQTEDKTELSRQAAEGIREFLARGRKINQIPMGQSALSDTTPKLGILSKGSRVRK